MCFRKKCGFLTLILCATKNSKPNVSKPCLNERTSKQFFTEIKKRRHKNHTVQLSRVNLDVPICFKVVWICVPLIV